MLAIKFYTENKLSFDFIEENGMNLYITQFYHELLQLFMILIFIGLHFFSFIKCIYHIVHLYYNLTQMFDILFQTIDLITLFCIIWVYCLSISDKYLYNKGIKRGCTRLYGRPKIMNQSSVATERSSSGKNSVKVKNFYIFYL